MKQIALIVFLLVFTFTSYAQKTGKNQTPDFTGTWIMDQIKSGLEGGMQAGKRLADMKMVIEHNEPEIKIIETIKSLDGVERVQNSTVYTDGRRKPINGKNDANNFVTYTWDEKTLVKTAKFVIGRGEGWDWFLDKNKKTSINMENREEWKLSKDGKTLTQRVFGGSAPSAIPIPLTFRYVFRRQD